MKVKTLDGKIFEGVDASEICWKIWNSMLKPNMTFKLWMRGSARRSRNWNGAIVRCANADVHLADLITYKIVELLEA